MTNPCASTGRRRMEANTEFLRDAVLAFTEIPDSGECIAGDTRQTGRQRQMVREGMDGRRILHPRRTTKRGPNHRVRWSCSVVVREPDVHINESGIARLHCSVTRLHVMRKNLLGDRHRTGRCVDYVIRLAAMRASFHEPEEAAVSYNSFREVIE